MVEPERERSGKKLMVSLKTIDIERRGLASCGAPNVCSHL